MAKERPLASLLEDLDTILTGEPRIGVRGVAYDSRKVRPGEIFVAVPGLVHDGLRFVPDAIDNGAAAVVAESAPTDDSIPWVRVPDARVALARLAAAWFDHPSRALTVVGVTGTNGKTTVTALLESILGRRAPAGRWSTTAVRYGDVHHDTPRTTPESVELQGALAGMREAGCRYGVVEVSSHALVLRRVEALRFSAAAFTNLSPDHLDFHGDMAAYLDAKAMLFESLPADAPAVINLSDPVGAELASRTTGRPVGYGWTDGAESSAYTILEACPVEAATRVRLATPNGPLALETPLLGRANAENVTAAVAVALELGISPETAVAAVAEFAGEPGRLERVDAGQPYPLLVDFAHTPGALEAALEAGRGVTAAAGRLIVVFGCGGDRDRAKRPLMGEIAARCADLAIVTSDNPRSESPEAIVDEILAGVPGNGRAEIERVVDRAAAIGRAVAMAGPGDCVIIAGKGHERDQTFAARTIPFDDRAVARDAILALPSPAGDSR